jgi:molybdopterin-guanine dinucleotide biosynthesis protein A
MDHGSGWTGVVLAGGRSSRMGQDKALIVPELQGKPDRKTLLELALDALEPVVSDLLVVGNPELHGFVGPFVIPDDRPGQGPLGGLVTAMHYATHDRLLVVAVDMPHIDQRLLRMLQQELGNFTDAVVPRHSGGIEALVAAYHRRCRPVFEERIAQGSRKMGDALVAVRTRYIDVEPGQDGWSIDLFRNLNRPEDL